MKGFILVNQYGCKKCFTTNKADAEFALKVFGTDWHIEEYIQPEFKPVNVAGKIMGYAC